jgi:1-acyl-sn-glycerol-3-phosphate acyltransferase
MIERFATREPFVLVVPAEGTRDYTEFWRSGFYHIARGANVPILPSFLDYRRKLGGFAVPLRPTDDIVKDMDYLRTVYAPMQGLHAGSFGPVRLREEREQDQGGPLSDPASLPSASSSAGSRISTMPR